MKMFIRLYSNNTSIIKFILIPVIIILLVLCSLPFYPAMAQNEKTGLDILIISSFNNTVHPGQDNSIVIEVRNSGDTTLTNVVLSSNAPANWTVNFSPSSIESLSPSGSQVINVDIMPPNNSPRGDYNITLIAENPDISQAISVYAQINSTPGIWLIIGAIILVVVIGIFVYVYFRYTRR